jgi:hypothetical protein
MAIDSLQRRGISYTLDVIDAAGNVVPAHKENCSDRLRLLLPDGTCIVVYGVASGCLENVRLVIDTE